VAKVYPELVIRNETGRIDGVRYDELAPMLLNEVQQQQRKLAAEAEKNAVQGARIAAQHTQLTAQGEHIAVQDSKIAQLAGQLAELHAAFEKQRTDAVVAQR
jgi:cell division FtsZ-interacting protein ZapD